MAKVNLSSNLPVSPESIWQLIGGFNTIPDWHPAVAKCEIETEGDTTYRRLSLVGGARGQDLQVTEVRPESPADRAGIETGDRLLAVDGTALASLTDLAGVDWSDSYDLELISAQGTMREITVTSSSARQWRRSICVRPL